MSNLDTEHINSATAADVQVLNEHAIDSTGLLANAPALAILIDTPPTHVHVMYRKQKEWPYVRPALSASLEGCIHAQMDILTPRHRVSIDRYALYPKASPGEARFPKTNVGNYLWAIDEIGNVFITRNHTKPGGRFRMDRNVCHRDMASSVEFPFTDFDERSYDPQTYLQPFRYAGELKITGLYQKPKPKSLEVIVNNKSTYVFDRLTQTRIDHEAALTAVVEHLQTLITPSQQDVTWVVDNQPTNSRK